MNTEFDKEDGKLFINYCRGSFLRIKPSIEIPKQVETYENWKFIIREYTLASSLYSITNQPVRHINIDVLLSGGVFIHDLC